MLQLDISICKRAQSFPELKAEGGWEWYQIHYTEEKHSAMVVRNIEHTFHDNY